MSSLFVDLQSDSVFRLTQIGGTNSARLPILVNLFYHRNHCQEHWQNHNDRDSFLLLRKYNQVALSTRVGPVRVRHNGPSVQIGQILITKVTD